MSAAVRVNWLLPEDGGRSALPTGHRYVTVSRFPEDGPEWPDGAWSVEVVFDRPPSEQGNPSVGTASFLVDAAPQKRLRPGSTFELYEGLKKVATVDLVNPK